MKVFKDDLVQQRFEEFLDKMLTGNEELLLQECVEKLSEDKSLTAETLEISFYSQSAEYFQALELINKITEAQNLEEISTVIKETIH